MPATYLERSGGEFVAMAKLLVMARGSPLDAAATAAAQRAPERAVRTLKSAVSAAILSDPIWAGDLADYRLMVGGFVESLRSASVFDRLLADGARRVPLMARCVVTTSGAVAAVVAAGAAKPISRMTLVSVFVEPRKATVIVPVSEEQARASSAEADLAREMRLGVSAATNAEFLSGVVTSSTPTVPGTADAAADVAAALELMTLHAGSRLYLIVTADTAARLALTTTTDGAFVYGDMSPQGGTIAGITVLVSDGLPPAASGASNALLIDASGLVLGDGTITLDATRHASLEMDDAPTHDATTPTGTQLVSMFQTNSVALRAERFFGFQVLRDDAVVVIEDAEW